MVKMCIRDRVNEALKQLAFPDGSMPEQEGVKLADIFRFYDKETITELAKRHGLSLSLIHI